MGEWELTISEEGCRKREDEGEEPRRWSTDASLDDVPPSARLLESSMLVPLE